MVGSSSPKLVDYFATRGGTALQRALEINAYQRDTTRLMAQLTDGNPRFPILRRVA
jgi:hypothetical protein